MRSLPQACALLCLLNGCHTAGSDWMSQPLPGASDAWAETGVAPQKTGQTATTNLPLAAPPLATPAAGHAVTPAASGRLLGRFRNTYYDFPDEADFQGKLVSLMSEACQPIKQVPLAFHDAVCVQGSGRLTSGVTVSFAKRDCACARTCPRTDQKICFEALSRDDFPWGRGALGKAITPLFTVAVDDAVIPMQAMLYVPEFDGLPLDTSGASLHDGCFVAQDRGLRVKGQHIDVFTGRPSATQLWNQLVPSNQGVTVFLDSSKCTQRGSRP